MVSDLGGVLQWHPEGAPVFVYGFCNLDLADELAGLRGLDNLRSHTNHPGVVTVDGVARYSTENSAHLGDPCDRLAEMGLLDEVQVNTRTWQAVAVGNLDEDPALEVWTIDQHRNLARLAED